MHRIREILDRKNITQAELARRLDTTPATVSRKLKGERGMTLEELFDFAEALEVPAFQLVAGSEDAELLGAEQRAILRAFNALDRAGQLAMLAEFANAALQDARPAERPARPPRHALPKH
jgi:transcriptional regulator with XRE-family HTH domain